MAGNKRVCNNAFIIFLREHYVTKRKKIVENQRHNNHKEISFSRIFWIVLYLYRLKNSTSFFEDIFRKYAGLSLSLSLSFICLRSIFLLTLYECLDDWLLTSCITFTATMKVTPNRHHQPCVCSHVAGVIDVIWFPPF